MATSTEKRKRTTRKATTHKPRTRRAERFDANESQDWFSIPSKGMLFSLAIAAFNGADFAGADILRDRAKAKEIITQAHEDGFLDKA